MSLHAWTGPAPDMPRADRRPRSRPVAGLTPRAFRDVVRAAGASLMLSRLTAACRAAWEAAKRLCADDGDDDDLWMW